MQNKINYTFSSLITKLFRSSLHQSLLHESVEQSDEGSFDYVMRVNSQSK